MFNTQHITSYTT